MKKNYGKRIIKLNNNYTKALKVDQRMIPVPFFLE